MTTQPHNARPSNTMALIDRLPETRGKLRENVPLAPLTWFRVGGPAEVLFRPADTDDLAAFLKNCPADIPLTVIGATSNLLVRDGGIPGVVIRLGGEFAKTALQDDGVIYAGAAALDVSVAKFAAANSRAGLAFLSGIPGAIGGGLTMNAGAYGGEFKDVLLYADAVARDGTLLQLTPGDLEMRYRHSTVPEGAVFTGAAFKTGAGNEAEILAAMEEIKNKREESQPIREKTGGSTFANPFRDNPDCDKHAWQLVDAAGCRGLKIGGAQISEKHCNFMINTGDATAADIEKLGETVRARVLEQSGISLRWEIRRIGVPLAE
ncbi:MAG: UDP-N-acetylmuramate dehydrogenase [Pseudomonadota bacterium]|nr:UDP-N-acetylmuramate dehydrogenase [Pseudomonadota bacterium]QKK04471.1 MAG: UDP-N-acetylmuramate dehydrogenase [Pseudomonadota bacterium]